MYIVLVFSINYKKGGYMKKKIFIVLAIISLSNSNCNRDQEEDKKANCSLAPAPAEERCEAAFKRAFFNPETEKCEVFIYGGCGGVVPFFNLEECRLYCENP